MPWLVRVRSTYSDLAAPAAKVTYEGRGFVVDHGEEQLVVTAAHLTQGGLSIEGEDGQLVVERFDAAAGAYVPVEIETIFPNNPSDTAVLLVKRAAGAPRLPALAEWVEASGFRSALPLRGGAYRVLPEAVGFVEDRGTWLDERWIRLGLWTGTPVLSLEDRLHDGFEGSDYQTLRALSQSTPWSFLGPRIVGMQAGATEYSADLAVRPGMSGSPVVYRLADVADEWIISGVVSARSRVFEQSYLSPNVILSAFVTEIVLPKMAAWRAGGTPFPPYYSDDRVQWYLRHGLLFRAGYVPGKNWS
jgi:hypothetical protein